MKISEILRVIGFMTVKDASSIDRAIENCSENRDFWTFWSSCISDGLADLNEKKCAFAKDNA